MNYSKLTIGVYEKIQELYKLPDAFQAKQEIYKLLTGKLQQDINSMVLNDFFASYNKASEFLNTPPKPVKITPFELKGVKYSPFLEYYDWQVWRMVSISNAASSASNNMAMLIALGVYEKKNESLSHAELTDRVELFRDNLTVDIAISYADFFLQCYTACTKIMENYSAEMVRVKTSQKNGDGTYPSTKPQEERLIYSE